MLLSKCAVGDVKKFKFIKEEEPSGLLSSLGIKKPLSKIPLLGPLSFRGINELTEGIKLMKQLTRFY